MIRDNQRYLNMIQIVLDGCLVALSYMLAWWIRFRSMYFDYNPVPEEGVLPMETYFSAIYYLVPAYLVLYFMFSLYYVPRRMALFRYELLSIINANIVGLIGFFVVLYIVKQTHFSRAMIFFFFFTNTMLSIILRWSLRCFLRAVRKRGYNLKHVLMVGYSRSAENYIARIDENPQWGYVIAGVLDDQIPVGTKYRGVRVIAPIDELQNLLDHNAYDEIIISLSLDHYDRLEELVARCEKTGVHTKFVPDYTSLFPSSPYTEDVLGLPVIHIRYVPLSAGLPAFLKRVTDIIGALVAIILFSPAMIISAIAIKLSSRGPVIFKQERIGLHGEPFMMYKFRTMRQQDEGEERKAWTTRNDPRVTPIGRFLRTTSLDETPQFFNVLAGKMSLVGPRPERPHFVEKFREQIPRYMIKHQVRPGITGWAQINGYRGDTSIRKRIEYDIFYIENWTPGFDARILFSTIFHAFRQKNAY
ncbi:MAG: undecaprenyl-phosphate glucose phosphotransferase [Lachnospiraceae bacterium]|nr:undecaprenyl-phosphate glucose phosphotransferase [Lachnospiraceae bacterium]